MRCRSCQTLLYGRGAPIGPRSLQTAQSRRKRPTDRQNQSLVAVSSAFSTATISFLLFSSPARRCPLFFSTIICSIMYVNALQAATLALVALGVQAAPARRDDGDGESHTLLGARSPCGRRALTPICLMQPRSCRFPTVSAECAPCALRIRAVADVVRTLQWET